MTIIPVPIKAIYQQIIQRCLNPDERALFDAFLSNGKLQPFIEEAIIQIELYTDGVKNGQPLNPNLIKTLSYSFLRIVNEHLKAIDDPAKKVQVKKILAKIARVAVLEIQQQAPGYSEQIKKAIDQGYEQALIGEGYDRADFESYIQINYTDISREKITIAEKGDSKEYYLWNAKKGSLKTLIRNLFDHGCIKSGNEFELFFQYPRKRSKVRWDVGQTDMLLLLFHQLYEQDYITLKGGKGKWKAVMGYFVDFSENPFDFDPAKRLHQLTGKKPLKPSLVKVVKEMVASIAHPQ